MIPNQNNINVPAAPVLNQAVQANAANAPPGANQQPAGNINNQPANPQPVVNQGNAAPAPAAAAPVNAPVAVPAAAGVAPVLAPANGVAVQIPVQPAPTPITRIDGQFNFNSFVSEIEVTGMPYSVEDCLAVTPLKFVTEVIPWTLYSLFYKYFPAFFLFWSIVFFSISIKFIDLYIGYFVLVADLLIFGWIINTLILILSLVIVGLLFYGFMYLIYKLKMLFIWMYLLRADFRLTESCSTLTYTLADKSELRYREDIPGNEDGRGFVNRMGPVTYFPGLATAVISIRRRRDKGKIATWFNTATRNVNWRLWSCLVKKQKFDFLDEELPHQVDYSHTLFKHVTAGIQVSNSSFEVELNKISRLIMRDTKINIPFEHREAIRNNTLLVAECFLSYMFECDGKRRARDVLHRNMHDSQDTFSGFDIFKSPENVHDNGLLTVLEGFLLSRDMRNRRDLN